MKTSSERWWEWGEERQETDSHQPSGKKMRQTDIRENIPKRKDEEQKEIENETPGEHDDHQHETPHNNYSAHSQWFLSILGFLITRKKYQMFIVQFSSSVYLFQRRCPLKCHLLRIWVFLKPYFVHFLSWNVKCVASICLVLFICQKNMCTHFNHCLSVFIAIFCINPERLSNERQVTQRR